MHLISSLAAGFVGAEGGTVEIYSRGTATPATTYDDFEATASRSGASLALDSSGRRVVYVNELVTIVVKSSGGSTLCTFVEGTAAPVHEVISQAFTGTSYENGSTGVGKPTTHQSVLDRWLLSAGAPDWKVLSGGSALTLVALLGGLSGLVFNVKSATYGATGLGVADDTAAIQAAHDAAEAGVGGNVFFPPGTYKTTAALTWDESVNYIGSGAICTTITLDHASANMFETEGSSVASPKVMSGLQLSVSQANSGILINHAHGSAGNTHILDCRIGGTNANGTGLVVAGANHRVNVDRCRFDVQTGGGAISATTVTGARIWVSDCHFVLPSNYASNMVQSASQIQISNCFIDCSANTTGAHNLFVNTNAAGATVITGCRVLGGTGTTTCFVWQTGAPFVEVGNSLPAVSANFLYCGAAPAVASVNSIFGSMGHVTTGISTGAYTVPNGVRSVTVNSTSATPTVFTMPVFLAPNQRLTIGVHNNSGGAWGTPYSFTGVVGTGVTQAPANLGNDVNAFHEFIVADSENDGTYEWWRIGP